MFYVYNLIDFTGKVFYVGKGRKKGKYDRLNYYKSSWRKNSNLKLVNKIKSLDEDFKIEVVFISESESECLLEEVRLIQLYGKDNLCNLTDGGQGVSGFKLSDDSISKMRDTIKSNPDYKVRAVNNLKKAIEVNTGNKKLNDHVDEIIELYKSKTIMEISKILNVSHPTALNFIKNLGIYEKGKNRKPHTEEQKQKIREASTGRLHTEESKNKMRKPKPPRTEEHKKNMRLSRLGNKRGSYKK